METIKNMSMIASLGRNRELGYQNDLVFHSKEDMRFFKETTINHTVVMGRKTYISLPKLLKDRKHVVLTSSSINNSDVLVLKNIRDLLNYIKSIDDEVFIIGGATLYKELIDYAYKLYLTEVDKEYKADCYFPYFNKEDYNCRKIYDNFLDVKYKRYIYTKKK